MIWVLKREGFKASLSAFVYILFSLFYEGACLISDTQVTIEAHGPLVLLLIICAHILNVLNTWILIFDDLKNTSC